MSLDRNSYSPFRKFFLCSLDVNPFDLNFPVPSIRGYHMVTVHKTSPGRTGGMQTVCRSKIMREHNLSQYFEGTVIRVEAPARYTSSVYLDSCAEGNFQYVEFQTLLW